MSFSSIHDGRFSGVTASSDTMGRAQPLAFFNNTSGPSSVPKLDLSLARTTFGSSASGAFGGGASFEEAQTSARSFGEDFDIQPPAPNRRDMERLRALREQKPLPSSSGNVILEPASSGMGGVTPVSALSRHAEDEVTTEMSTIEEAETPKLKELRLLAEHLSQTRSISAASTHRRDDEPAGAPSAAAPSAHRPAADAALADRPADRPPGPSLGGGSGVATWRSWDGGATAPGELGADMLLWCWVQICHYGFRAGTLGLDGHMMAALA
jgi:hypothetical protein